MKVTTHGSRGTRPFAEPHFVDARMPGGEGGGVRALAGKAGGDGMVPVANPSRQQVRAVQKTPSTTVDRAHIFLLDPYIVVLRGLVAMIGNDASLVVCGQACSPEAAVPAIATLPVDLIITGLNFPGCRGVEVVSRLKTSFPQIPLLVFSFRSECARPAMQAGAQGCVDKAEDWETLSAAIRCLVSGGVYLSHHAVAGLSSGATAANGRISAQLPERLLSRQEMMVFERMGNGLMPSEIAAGLNVSVRTVESYCVRIRDKLGVAGCAELRQRAVTWMRSRSG